VFCLRSGSQFKSGGEGGRSVAYFTHDELATDPFVACHDLVKIRQPPWLPQSGGRSRLDVTLRHTDKWHFGPDPEGATAGGRLAAASRIGLGVGTSRDGREHSAELDLKANNS
jgi:hypothetical protein